MNDISAFGVVHKRQMTQAERRKISRERRLADEKWERQLDDVTQQIFSSDLPEHNKRAIASEFKQFARAHRANEESRFSLQRGWRLLRHTPDTNPKRLWKDYAKGTPQASTRYGGRQRLSPKWNSSDSVEVINSPYTREKTRQLPGYGKQPKLLEGPKRVEAGVTPWPRHGAPVRDWSQIVKSLRLPGKKIVHSTDLTRSGKKFAESVSKSIPSEFAAQLAARSSKGRVVWHASKAPHKKIRRRGLKPNAPWGKAAAKAAKGSTYPYDLTRSKSVFTSTSPAEATRYAQPGSRLYAIDPDAVKIRGSFEEGEGVETVLGRVPRSAILHSQNVKPGTQRRF